MMPRASRLTATAARNILSRCNISYGTPFDDLRSAAVNELTDWADRVGYHRPKQSTGSRGRHFHAYLTRTIARELA